eukprot:1421159-Rhodomonas_salina.2
MVLTAARSTDEGMVLPAAEAPVGEAFRSEAEPPGTLLPPRALSGTNAGTSLQLPDTLVLTKRTRVDPQADGNAAAAAQLLTRILVMAPGAPLPLPSERIRVMIGCSLSEEVEQRLRGEILGVCAFVADLQ